MKTSPNTPLPPATKTVTIPQRVEHEGIYSRTVTLVWLCPVCGEPRGEPYESLSFDGSRRLHVHGWTNPCGHVDKYEAVRKEADAFNGVAMQELVAAVKAYKAPAVLDCAIPLLDLYEVELEAGESLPLELEDAFEYIECGDKVRVNPGYGRRMFEGYVEVSYPLYQRAIVRHWRGNYRMEVGVDELELLLKASALELETALLALANSAV